MPSIPTKIQETHPFITVAVASPLNGVGPGGGDLLLVLVLL